MMRKLGGVALATILATTSTGTMAQALTWRVSETSGQVTIRHGAATRPAQRGTTLEVGDAVATGAGGRAVLVHDRDFVTVSSNSRLTVPAAQAGGFIKMVQDWGNAIFKVEKRGVPHFGVNTPYLAAVVKGTIFSVTVDANGASLQVTEGAVEVATLDGGARDLIRPGAVAQIAAADLFRLHVHGDEERTVDSPARPTAVPSGSVVPTAGTATTVPQPAAITSAEAGAGSEPVELAAGTTIDAPVFSKPIDLGAATEGFVTGSSDARTLIAVVAVTEAQPATMNIIPAAVAPVPVPPPEPAAAAPAPAPAPEPVAITAPPTAPNTGKDKATADTAAKEAADKSVQDRAAQDKAASDQAIENKPEADNQVAGDQPKADKAADDKAAADKESADKAARDKAASDRAVEDKARADKQAADDKAKADDDKSKADKEAADKVAQDKAKSDKAASDKAIEDKEKAEKQAADDKAADDKAKADKAADDKVKADKDTADEADKDKADKDKAKDDEADGGDHDDGKDRKNDTDENKDD